MMYKFQFKKIEQNCFVVHGHIYIYIHTYLNDTKITLDRSCVFKHFHIDELFLLKFIP